MTQEESDIVIEIPDFDGFGDADGSDTEADNALARRSLEREKQRETRKARAQAMYEEAEKLFAEGDLSGIGANVYNALGKPAAELNSETAEALKAAAAFSPLAYAVTGSGSAVFALFESEEMCRWAKSRYKGKIPVRVVHTVEAKERRTGARNPFFLSEEELEEAETGNLKTGAEDGREKS